MTAAIKNSLIDLHGAIESLENSVISATANKKKAQTDLFSVPLNKSNQSGASNDVDSKMLAGRLDSAIAKVEKLLREG